MDGKKKILIALSMSLIFLYAPVAIVATATEKEYTMEATIYSGGNKEMTTVSHMTKNGILKLIGLQNAVHQIKLDMNQNSANVTEFFSKVLEKKIPLLSLISSMSNSKPFHEKVLIISNGYGKRININTGTKLRFYKFFTVWHYFGTKDYTTKSRTIIIDPANGQMIRSLKGWQIGIMKNFVGIYINIRGSMFDKDHILFIGFASKVIAFDLPDPITME